MNATTRKSYTPSSVKFDMDGTQGQFICHFGKLGVVDKDGDILVPGLLNHGQGDGKQLKVRISSWGHKWQELPVGRGEIYEEGDQVVCSGKFFLDTDHGLQTYKTVKALAELCEWSFGFDVLVSEPGQVDGRAITYIKAVDVFEVSPVMQGAGRETRTVDIKSAALPFEATEPAPVDAGWDSSRARTQYNGRDSLRLAHAWMDDAGDPDSATSYKFAHHYPDGTVSYKGVIASMSSLLSGGGGVPDEHRETVYKHLAKHYEQFNQQPPEFKVQATGACKNCGTSTGYHYGLEGGTPCANCGSMKSACQCSARDALVEYEVVRAKLAGVPVE